MRRRIKDRNIQISADYVSATDGNSGILRDMAGCFAGKGRYVVPSVTAVCAVQGMMLPMGQVYAAVVTPTDSATVGIGDSMTVPDAGISSVSGVNVNNAGSMTLANGGVATSTTLNGGVVLVSSGGTMSTTNINGGQMHLYSGAVESDTIVNDGSLIVSSGGVVKNVVVNSSGKISAGNAILSGTHINTNSSGYVVIRNSVASYTTIDGGDMFVYSSSEAVDTIINSGRVFVAASSLASNTTVNNDGILNVGGTGSTSTDTTINSGGLMRVYNSGVSSADIVVNGGFLIVWLGGLTNNSTVNSGIFEVSSGGLAETTVVNSGGSMTLTEGSATSTTINGGTMTVSSGGLATSTTVDLDGTMTLIEGTASNTTVNSGTMAVSSGGVADTTAVNSGGSMTLTEGSAASTTISGGTMTVSSGGLAVSNTVDLDGTMMLIEGSATDTAVNSGLMTISSGGAATTTTVNSGGSVTVSSGGVVSSTTIINGGSVTIEAGSATDTNISSGTMALISGGTATDTTVHSGGSLSVTSSSTVNNVILSGGVFTNPNAGSVAFISGTVTGAGDITGPGDFTLANGNVLLNSGSISTTGKWTLNKVLDTTKPAVSATDFNVGILDITDLDTGTSTSGTLIKTDTVLPAVMLTSGTSSSILDNVSTSVIFGGGMHTDSSIPGFTLDYNAPSVTYSLVNSAKEIDYSLNGNKQATKLTFGSIGWLDTGAFLDHTTQFADVVFNGAAVDTSGIHFNNVASLQANKTMTLVSNFGTSVGAITGTKYTVGTTLQGNGKAELVGNDLVYKVETDSVDISPKAVAQEQTHNVLMGMDAGLAVINSGQDFIEQAIDGFGEMRNTGEDGVAVFAAMGGGKGSYETGSHINLNTWNGIVGLGKSHELENGKFQWGGFVEHGSGNFNIHNADLQGDGSSTYTGGGIAAKWTNKHDVYTEVGLRYGKVHDSTSNILQDALGNSYGYNVHADYYGGYLGLGKVYRLGPDKSLDVYGKFYSTHRDGVSFDAGGHYDLDGLQSNILRVGAKYRAKAGKVNWYGGLAYEHEFGGEATGRADGVPIRAASVKGGSLRADFGVSLKASEESPWTMDLGITGHTGKHSGIGGRIFIGCKF